MASKTIDFNASASSGKYIDAKIVWTSSANATTNTSSLIVSLYVRKGDTTQTLTIPTSGTWNYTLTIDGGKVSGAVNLSVLEDWVLVATKSIGGLVHNDNGTKSITIAGSVTAPSATSFSGHTSSGSGTATFDTIPRATSIDSLTCSTNYFDGTLTYKYTPKSASYYNRCNIALNINGAYTNIKTVNLGKKATSQQTATVTLTASELQTIYNALPNDITGILRFTFRTYSDSGYSVQVGSAGFKELTLTIPTSISPTATLTLEASNSNAWIKSLGVYVQNYSGVKATLTGSAGTGASITSRKVTGGDYSSDTNVLEIPKITTSGSFKITGRVSDSRLRGVAVNKTINVLPYAVPAISKLEVTRGEYSGGWTANETGKDVKITFRASLALVAQGNKYSATFKLGSSAITPNSGATTNLTSGEDNVVYLSNVDGESSHTLTFTAKDLVGNSSSAKLTIPTFNVTIEFNGSGKGIAFGKTSEKDAFECAFPAEFSGGVKLIRDDGTIIAVGDTGWINLGVSDAVTTEGAGTGRNGPGCWYRVVNGNHVYVAFCVLFTFAGQAIQVNATAIPSQYRPKVKAYTLNPIGGYRVSRVGVSSGGNVVIDWAQDLITGELTTSTPSIWVDGYIDYFI